MQELPKVDFGGTIAGERLEATPGIEPGFTDLQSAASPLRHVASTKMPENARQAAGGYNRKQTETTTGHVVERG
jgi:hypothetical protein